MNILEKIQEELNNIHVQQKINSGNIINENDIKKVFTILKEKDPEVKPLLELIEKLLLKNEDYLLMENSIVQILKYYNLSEKTEFINCRHKYFFSDDKKLIKRKFFTEDHERDIKTKIQEVYKKL
jgi:hypothetical protein